MKTNVLTIKCPHCGQEYLPAEIFYPDSFLGKPSCIEKDSSGRIELYDGESMNLEEDYCCDCCGNNFHVKAAVSFNTSVPSEKKSPSKTFFNEEYATSLKLDRISLFEQ